MPRPPGRPKKLLGEVPSSQSFEFVSHVRRGGKVVKKRTIEKTDFDPQASPIIFPDDDVLPALCSQVDPPDPASDASEGPSSDAASRSVSVKYVFVCHVTSHSDFSQTKVQEWIPRRAEFLYELLRLECLPPQNMSCSACKSPANYRCLSCFTAEVMCKGCLLSHHSIAPLHNVQVCPLRVIAEVYH